MYYIPATNPFIFYTKLEVERTWAWAKRTGPNLWLAVNKPYRLDEPNSEKLEAGSSSKYIVFKKLGPK